MSWHQTTPNKIIAEDHMRSLSVAFLVLALANSQSFGAKAMEKVVAFWIPSQVEMYAPVTAENIEQMAFKIVSVKNERQADQVVKLIERTDQKLDAYRIRIKISTGQNYYNFDANGIGISSNREQVKIDIQKLKQVLCE
jgi:putative lipoic acid-binding regulatory protein